jgi:hypothetical protein
MSEQESKNERIMVRFELGDRRELERLAAKQRRPLSQMLRAIALDWLDDQLVKPQRRRGRAQQQGT